MDRQQFCKQYLSLFGVVDIKFKRIDDKSIYGTAIYDLYDPDEIQDFIIRMKENSLPSSNMLRLIGFINKNNLLDIDCIKIPRDILKERFEKECCKKLKQNEFDDILNELESINISMVDDGVETDGFFIHE